MERMSKRFNLFETIFNCRDQKKTIEVLIKNLTNEYGVNAIQMKRSEELFNENVRLKELLSIKCCNCNKEVKG
jgi:hypothetical protein